ncbi:MAG TPA: hypothetical protein VKF40_22620 [Burkholderiales bacterium]|nr:hypothetical protein [Burkholderiales bacterium]
MRASKTRHLRPKRHDEHQPGSDKEHGEGNYKASRQYNEATRKFVQSGRVEGAARKAKPRNEQERDELRAAEQVGRRESKGEDPALYGEGDGFRDRTR